MPEILDTRYDDPRLQIDPNQDKPGPADPPPLSDEDEARAERAERLKQIRRQSELAEESFSQERDILARREKELNPAYEALSGAARGFERASGAATQQYLRSQQDVPEFKQPDIRGDAFAWVAAASVLGALAGARARQGGTTALTAFNGAMTGLRQGNLQAYEQNYKTWQANAERTYEMNARAGREYEAVMKNARLDFDTKANLVKMIAAKYDDQLMITQAEQRHIERMTQLMDAQGRANDNYQLRTQQMQQHHDDQKQKMQLDAAKNGLVLDDDGNYSIDKRPDGPMASRAKAIADYKQAPCSGGTGRSGGLCNQLMAWVQQLNPSYDASVWTGKQAYQRVAGTYGARVETATNEVAQFIPQALQASSGLPRGKWVSINKLIQDYQAGKSDPRYYDFAFANYSLLNAYSRAINPTGVPRIQDKEHAMQFLNTVTDEASYKRVLFRMAKEVQASHAAVAMTRGDPDASANLTENIMRMSDQELANFIATNGNQVKTPGSSGLGGFVSSGGGIPATTQPIHGPGTEPQQPGEDPFAGFERVR
jgi:hypothetical protein